MSTRIEQFAARVTERLGQKGRRVASTCAELTFEVDAQYLIETATALRDELGMQMLIDVCGVDYLDYGQSEWETYDSTDRGYSRGVQRAGRAQRPLRGDERATPRFAVVYHLLSISANLRLRLRVYCPDDDAPVVDSVNEIWPAANWFEREAFDLYGILFRNHPDLRRILTDYGFIGHPFRKDFPLTGNVEVRYDPQKGRVVYQPVSIEPRTLVPKVIRSDHRYLSDSTEGLSGDD